MVRVTSRPALVRRRIDIVKEHVSCIQVVQDMLSERALKGLVSVGERWRGICLLCGNGAHSGAFSCGTDLWHCFACMEGGDVITLVMKAYDFKAGQAAAWLGHRYNVELPERLVSWYRKVDRQARTRELLAEKRKDVKRRRLFRYFILPELEKIEDAGERETQTKLAWEDFRDFPVYD